MTVFHFKGSLSTEYLMEASTKSLEGYGPNMGRWDQSGQDILVGTKCHVGEKGLFLPCGTQHYLGAEEEDHLQESPSYLVLSLDGKCHFSVGIH